MSRIEGCWTFVSCFTRIWMSHVTWMSHDLWMRHVTHKWMLKMVFSFTHICMRSRTLVIASCHTYEWVMLHMWLCRVSHMNCNSICIYTYGSCHAYEWVMSHVRLSRDTHMQKVIWHVLMFFFSNSYGHPWVMRKGHVTQIDESWHKHKSNVSRLWVMAHSETWHIWVTAHIYESWHTYKWLTSHARSRTWVVCESWHIVSDGTYESWHTFMSHGTHLNDSRHTHEWVMLCIWMSHVTHTEKSRHTYEWVTPHIWMSHVAHMMESCHAYEYVMPHVWMSPITHMNESYHTCEWVM